tara:strand:+ start:324 stop:680 length:357 start_codon:yes stop_codon:yes gene_type:complete
MIYKILKGEIRMLNENEGLKRDWMDVDYYEVDYNEIEMPKEMRGLVREVEADLIERLDFDCYRFEVIQAVIKLTKIFEIRGYRSQCMRWNYEGEFRGMKIRDEVRLLIEEKRWIDGNE